jgi:hypothetical protein
MTEQSLYEPDIDATLYQKRCGSVPENMGRDLPMYSIQLR